MNLHGVFIFLFVSILTLVAGPDSQAKVQQSADATVSSIWSPNCYNATTKVCNSFRLGNYTPSCTGVGQQVDVCPLEDCIASCTLTDVMGNVNRVSYYEPQFLDVNAIRQQCTSMGGLADSCKAD